MLEYGYFDSEIVGYDDEGMPEFDRAQSSDIMAKVTSMLISDGVLGNASDNFQVFASEGMKLEIRPGFGMVQGRYAYDLESAEIELEPAPKSYTRIDRVILRANYRDRCCEIIKKTGVVDPNPTAPALERPEAGNSGDYYELSLATITVKSNQTVISQANIEDTRGLDSQCGFIHALIEHVSTDTLFVQYTAWYKETTGQAELELEEWFRKFTNWYEPTKIEFEKAIREAEEKADLANAAASRVNVFIDTVEQMIAAGAFQGEQGPQGVQGIPGENGEKGERGDSGIVVPLNGFFTLSVDAPGNLWAYFADNSSGPVFEYDTDTGATYFITPDN